MENNIMELVYALSRYDMCGPHIEHIGVWYIDGLQQNAVSTVR